MLGRHPALAAVSHDLWLVGGRRALDALSDQLEPLLERTHLTGPLSGLTRVVARDELAPWLDDLGSCVIRWEPAAHDLDPEEAAR